MRQQKLEALVLRVETVLTTLAEHIDDELREIRRERKGFGAKSNSSEKRNASTKNWKASSATCRLRQLKAGRARTEMAGAQ